MIEISKNMILTIWGPVLESLGKNRFCLMELSDKILSTITSMPLINKLGRLQKWRTLYLLSKELNIKLKILKNKPNNKTKGLTKMSVWEDLIYQVVKNKGLLLPEPFLKTLKYYCLMKQHPLWIVQTKK